MLPWLILLAPLACVAQQDQEQALQSLTEKAAQAQAANDYQAAAAAYRQAAVLRPDVPELWANLGLMLHQSGDYTAAIESFRRANAIKPSLYVPNLFLGIDLFETGRAKEALPWLARAQAMNRSDVESYLFFGRAYASLGRPSEAIAAIGRAMELDPKRSQLWFYLGMIRLDEVEDEARTLAAVGHDSPSARTLYAESLLRQSRYNEAVEVLRSTPALGNPSPCARAELGLAYLMTHDVDDARAQFEPAAGEASSCALLGQIRMDIDAGREDAAIRKLQTLGERDEGFLRSTAPLFMEGIAPQTTGQFTAALQQATQAGEISGTTATSAAAAVNNAWLQPESGSALNAEVQPPGSATAAQDFPAGRYGACARRAAGAMESREPAQLRLLTACSFLTGNDARASQAAAEWRTSAPHSLEALYWQIKANEHLADSALQRYKELEPNSEQTHLLLGDSDRQRKLYDEAQTEYRRALDLQPNDPAALLGLAWAYFGTGDTDNAIRTAQAALDQRPSDPEINLLMGEALLERHRFADAEPYLNRSLSAKPQMVARAHALLGRVYQETGRTADALRQLQLGLPSDTDGTVHYELARVYRQMGDEKDAQAALAQMKALQQQRRDTAILAIEDTQSARSQGGPQ
jgi:tetratricopeptide (TPR) repeat protein